MLQKLSERIDGQIAWCLCAIFFRGALGLGAGKEVLHFPWPPADAEIFFSLSGCIIHCLVVSVVCITNESVKLFTSLSDLSDSLICVLEGKNCVNMIESRNKEQEPTKTTFCLFHNSREMPNRTNQWINVNQNTEHI